MAKKRTKSIETYQYLYVDLAFFGNSKSLVMFRSLTLHEYSNTGFNTDERHPTGIEYMAQLYSHLGPKSPFSSRVT